MPAGWQDRAHDLLDRFDLGGDADRLAATFSHGMGRRLSVVLAAFHSPDVLLLDEPFDGVDPLGVEATMEVIRELRLDRLRRPGLHAPARPGRPGLRPGGGPAPGCRGRRRALDRARGGRGSRPLPVVAVVSTAQLAPLLALRWQMVRSRRSRRGFALLAAAVPVLCVAAVVVGLLAPRDRSLDFTLLAPTAYLSVALLAAPRPAGVRRRQRPVPLRAAHRLPDHLAHRLPRHPRADPVEPGLDDAAGRPARPDRLRQRSHPADAPRPRDLPGVHRLRHGRRPGARLGGDRPPAAARPARRDLAGRRPRRGRRRRCSPRPGT